MLFALLAIPLENLLSQNLQNLTGGKIKNAGTIRFVVNTGELQNEAAADAAMGVGYDGEFVATSGTVEFAGSTNVFGGLAPFAQAELTRINGWVVYNSGAMQTLDDNTWYTNLGLRGAGEKQFGAGQYNVDFVYQSDRAGTRNYGTSTFIYDGGTDENGASLPAGSEDQDVFAENGAAAATNAYYNFFLLNDGIKTLQTDATYWENNAMQEINLDLGAVYIVKGTQNAVSGCVVNTTETAGGTTAKPSTIDVYGGATAAQDGWFRTNDGAGTIDGDVYIHNGGTYITDGTGLQTFSGAVVVGNDYLTAGSTSGSLTLDQGDMYFDATGPGGLATLTLDNANGHIVNGDGRLLKFIDAANFEVNPAWATGTNERPNMEFHVNSTTEYAGTDDIEAAVKDYPYGNLKVSSAANELIEQTAGAVCYVAGNFELTAADLWVDSDTDPSTGTSQVLAMLDETKDMIYTDVFEVVGGVRRYPNSTSTTMTFNNTATKSAITDVNTEVEWFQYSIWKGEAPNENGTGNAYDVDRRTLFNVSETGQNWKAMLRLGYLKTECAQTTSDYYNSLRFRRYTPNAGADDKITTGIAVNRHIAFDQGLAADNGFAYAELFGFTTGEYDVDTKETVPDGDEVFLRGGPTWFITVNNGRWSNPNTWDEGIQPGPNDLCLVRHTCWAGFVNNLDGYTTNETEHLANNFGTTVSELTSYIQIYNAAAAAPAPAYHGALIFGEGIAGTDNASTHEMDPAWALKTDSPLSDLSAWEDLEGEIGATITQGTIYATDIVDGAEVEVDDADIELQHYAAGVATLYNGGLFVHAQTQLTVPTLLTNKAIIKNAGTIIVGE